MKLPVTEVAMACGFSSSAYFASAYRGHFGYPPRAERRTENRFAERRA